MELSRRRLSAFLALYETRDMAQAAAQLGTTRAAVYDSMRVLQELLELPLFETSASGLRSSAFADALASHVSLALSLLQHGLDEVRSLDGGVQGRLVIGTLPYSRSVLVPRSIVRLLQDHPQLSISTREGPYDVLEAELRSGAVDLIVGATRKHEADSPMLAETLFEDELAVICGAHHPLAQREEVSVTQLLEYGWVLPLRTTPARQLFDRFLRGHGVAEPRQIIETGSLSMARGLLLESHRLALLSSHQVQLDQAAGLLCTLPIKLKETFRPIGITRRARSRPSPAALLFMDCLRSMAPEFQSGLLTAPP
jgi:LysR family transcriptional regulator of gallate degradation